MTFVKQLVYKSRNYILNFIVCAVLRRNGVKVGNRTRFLGIPFVEATPDSKILIGDSCLLISKFQETALGVSHPVILRTLKKGAAIVIGNDSGLSGTTINAAIGVSIGSRCLIGADVLICDTDFHPISYENRRYADLPTPHEMDRVYLGDDVFVGARAIILKGVTIGRGSVVGAGSVVTKSFADFSIIAGNPAKKIGDVR